MYFGINTRKWNGANKTHLKSLRSTSDVHCTISYKNKDLSNRNIGSPTLIHVHVICVGIMEGIKEKMRKINEDNIDFLLSFSNEEL